MRTFRGWLVMGLFLPAVLFGIGAQSASADVSAVVGSAFGYSANVTLFGSQQTPAGPAPTVSLPPQGSANPITASAPSAAVIFGPATIFSSGAITVSTQGTTGPTGSVTSSSTVNGLNASHQEVFTASSVSSTCTASQSGVTGSTTINGGTLQTSEGNPAVTGDETVVNIPANPAPNTVVNGQLQSVGDTFQYIFNEQITNADGSITVNAVHQRLLGPTATGDVYIGRSVCGVTVVAGTTTTTAGGSTTTTTAATTSTTAPTATTATSTSTTTAATTSTAASNTTTTLSTSTTSGGAPTVSAVSGGAFGFRASVSLFGGPAATRGPDPTVTLPSTGADPALTSGAATGSAVYGPATVFTSGPITVSTGGTTGPNGSVNSSVTVNNINTSGQEVFTANAAAATCRASLTGISGSTTITGGTIITSEGDPDVDGDETTVNVSANPAPNTTINGRIESVGDTYRYVFNEQVTNSDGSITVNAAHQVLLGPTATGDLIIGQVRCGLTSAGSGGGGSGGSGGSGGGGGAMVRTGNEAAKTVAVGAVLMAWGWTAIRWTATWRRRGQLG